MSKNWAMTGWRVGWLEAPVELGPTIENLVQYSTSGVPLFTQRAAIAALNELGETTFHTLHAQAAASRAVLMDLLGAQSRIRFAPPEGAFYLFFQIKGVRDARDAALRLVDEAGLGLAPGTAFGAAGAGYFPPLFRPPPGRHRGRRQAAPALADAVTGKRRSSPILTLPLP